MTPNFRPRLWWLALCLLGVVLVGCPPVGGPKLTVSPTALSFGSAGVEDSIAIGNDGSGSLQWTLSNTVSWLTPDLTSGTVTDKLQRVHLTVDRTGLAPGGTYSGTFTINSNGGTKTVSVAVTVPGTPAMTVSPQTLSFLGTTNTATLTINNTGNGPLHWNLALQDPNDATATIPLPSYLTLSATGGVTAAGGQSTVTATVDFTSLQPGIINYTLLVQSDGGNASVGINIGVDTSAVIGVDPTTLDFGQDSSELTLNVFNDGPSGTTLNFTLSTDRPDLIFMDPLTGQSAGTSDPTNKNDVPVTVTIDRSALHAAQDGGTITISADGNTPVQVPVTAKQAPLTFEGAINRSRPPFIQRFVFLMRDGTGKAVDSTNPAILQQLQTVFTVQEDGVVLDPAESNVFITGPQNLKYNIVLMLDFTGSMYDAEGGNGTAITQMINASKGFITSLPASYRIALMEYHDRQETNRLIHGFSTDKQALLDALDAYTLGPGDHGASEVWDAVTDACTRLVNQDTGVLPFDDADVRAVVFITDGRDDSSISTKDELSTFAQNSRVRLYPIGFGDSVNTTPLLQLATETGGHYYPASSSAVLTSLLDTQSGVPGLVPSDLARQIVLTYITLFQGGSHNYLITANYQGLQGSFQRNEVVALGGDVRAGQISLRTAGIQSDGTAEVYVRAEYVPRGVTQFRLRFITSNPNTVEIVPGGLLDGWTMIPEGGGVYTFLTSDTNYLRYGSFGNLVKVTFSGLGSGSFDLGFRVDDRIYVNPPTTKFFQYPFSITVGTGSSSADVVPLALSAGFNPDAPGAFDTDGDGVPDFNDLYPTDPLRSKGLVVVPAAPAKAKE